MLIDAIYRIYGRSNRNPVKLGWYRVLRNRRAAKALFGVAVDDRLDGALFDLTTLLLKREIEANHLFPDARLLEIGVGRIAALSGSLSRRVRPTVDATDIDPAVVASAEEHVRRNGFDVSVSQSDVFAAVPDGKTYDVIFWNLPYYRSPDYLERLFADAPRHLADGGKLIIGYNSVALPRALVLQYLARHWGLALSSRRAYWWNRHDVLVLTKV